MALLTSIASPVGRLMGAMTIRAAVLSCLGRKLSVVALPAVRLEYCGRPMGAMALPALNLAMDRKRPRGIRRPTMAAHTIPPTLRSALLELMTQQALARRSR